MKHYYDKKGRPGYKKLISIIINNINIRLYTMEGIFSSSGLDQGTKLLLENIMLPKNGEILDLGCGNGVIGIYSLLANPALNAIFVDINPAAIRLAQVNAKINSVEERAKFLVSDLYDGLKNYRFNAIYTNPPLSAGWKVVARILIEAPNHLEKGGWLQAVFFKGEEKAKKIAKEVFKEIEVVKRKRGYSVLLFLI